MPLDILPLTAGHTASDRIWVSSRKTCRSPTTGRPPSRRTGTPGCAPRSVPTPEAAPELGQLSAHAGPEQLAGAAVAFTHGLVVQTLLDPGRFSEDAQVAPLDSFLASLVAS
ncbi:TetR family transcriptional regulator C-terminal domain-containing protein [Streptomyces griseoluteus]|uniref:TetR family transcriptional regulator C-terminal domain-containing protein n=1 Tax=Streptomyces griseoluteus TaxID=29306 RepID=UPI0037035B14